MIATLKSRILPASNFREMLLLRLFYAPAYRFLKSLAVWLGFLRSLTKKWIAIPLSSGFSIIQ